MFEIEISSLVIVGIFTIGAAIIEYAKNRYARIIGYILVVFASGLLFRLCLRGFEYIF